MATPHWSRDNQGGEGGGGGGGYSDISYIRRLGSFLGFKTLNFNFFFFFGGGWVQKNDFLGGMKILWIFFGVIATLGHI